MKPALPFTDSLATRFAGGAAVLAAVVVFGLGLGSWWWTTEQQAAAYRALLDKEAELHAAQVANRLRSLADRLHSVADSSLLATALVDSSGRETYLAPFLSGLQHVDGIPVQVLFTDFEGKEIASNGQARFTEAEMAWLQARLEDGRVAAEVFAEPERGEALMVIELLTYSRTRTPEGALAYKVALADLFNDPAAHLMREGARPSPSMGGPAPVEWPVETPEIFRPLGFTILLAPEAFPNAPHPWQIALIYGIAGLLALLVALAAGRRLGGYLTADLRALATFAQRVMAEGFGAQRVRIADRGEVGSVADAVNRMLDRLNALHQELQAASAELHAESERYRLVADFATDWETWLTEGGGYRYVSPSCERITGHPPTDFMKDPGLMTHIAHPDDRDLVWRHFSCHNAEHHTVETLEFRILRTDGALAWIEHVCRPVYGDDGRFLGRRGSNRDITDRKRLEADLMLAKEAAEQSNRSKSLFLANMSHELRTPLNAILGFAQLMAGDASLSEDQRHNLETINRSGGHLLALINDVLEISRIEAGRLAANPTDFDLYEVLRALTEMMDLRAREKGLALHLECAADLPRHVTCDLGKLRQVLLNLLSNAVKYTPGGEVHLRAASLPEASGATLTFEVCDTGAGIEEGELARIFDPFYQAQYGILRGEGTGLGLAIVRQYVELLGGTLEAESTPGRGSCFRFRLPVVLPAAAPPPHAEAPPRILGRPPNGPEVRILVAEDDPASRRLMIALMQQAGFHARPAENGRQAVELCAEWSPHLIWMDMRMPEMDGYEATRRIRELPNGRTIRIVALTASAFKEDRAGILAAGCDAVATKPIDAQALLAEMGRQLGLEYRYAEPDTAAATPEELVAALRRLSASQREALREAALTLEFEVARGVIDAIQADAPALAQALNHLLENFEFDTLLALVEHVALDHQESAGGGPDGPRD